MEYSIYTFEETPESGKKNPQEPAVGEGKLIVMVTSSAGGYPLANATVSVYDEEGPQKFMKRVLTTDSDGKTPTVALPAPVLTPEQQFECKIRPYSVYTVQVEFPQFYTNIHKDVQVFAGIDSIVNSFMVPLPANIGKGSKTKIYVVPPTRCFRPAGGGE